MEIIDSFLRMRDVERLGIIAALEKQNLMEHSFGVLFLFTYLCKSEKVPYTINDVDLVQLHDILETETGDIPYPAKNLNENTKASWAFLEGEVIKQNPHLKEYTDKSLETSFSSPRAYRLFKESDLLDLFLFCKRQQKLGNRTGRLLDTIDNCLQFLGNASKTTQNIVRKYANG